MTDRYPAHVYPLAEELAFRVRRAADTVVHDIEQNHPVTRDLEELQHQLDILRALIEQQRAAPVRPLLLDLYCGAGGAAMGYHQAGFDVIGVDNQPQPNFPFAFMQADAISFLRCYLDPDLPSYGWFDAPWEFDVIHASPPCQAYTMAQRIRQREHPDLVAPTRELLNATGLPWVIENVPGSPLIDPVVLEGQMFEGLRTQRKRWFETNWPLDVPFLRSPRPARQAKMGRKPKPHEWFQVVGNTSDAAGARRAMGIDWMNRDELSQAIPPAYTQFIGEQLLTHLRIAA